MTMPPDTAVPPEEGTSAAHQEFRPLGFSIAYRMTGSAWAAVRPFYGPERVARFMIGLLRRGQKMGASGEPVWVNGQPGAMSYDAEGRVLNVFALDIADGAWTIDVAGVHWGSIRTSAVI